MKRILSLIVSSCLCISFGFLANQASARTLSDEELSARAMDQGRTLESRILALKKLYSHMLVDGEIPERTVCVWDVLGKQGPIYAALIDQRIRLSHYGIAVNVEAYTNEQHVVDKLKEGFCDTSIMSGAKAKQFNDFTGSIESLGGVPTRRHMKYLLQVLASTHAYKKMVQGNYHVVGVIPIGFNYLFTHTPTQPRLSRLLNRQTTAAAVKQDVSQNALFSQFDTKLLPVQNTSGAAGAYNSAEADVFMSPLVGFNMFSLGEGLKTGSILDYPLSQMTLQVISRLDTIPMEVGQFLREDIFVKTNMFYRKVENNTRGVPREKMLKLSADDEAVLDAKIQQVRQKLTDNGSYNAGMMKLQKNIRCKIDKQRDECKK